MYALATKPRSLSHPWGSVTLTHSRDIFRITPGGTSPVVIYTQKGFMHQGVFVDYGEPEVREMNEAELDTIIQATNNQTLGAVRLRDLFQAARKTK